MTAAYDVVVVGSGVAGLSVALELAGARRVALVSSGAISSGSTAWAQGGLAAAIGHDDDARQHAADTELAGAGACDPAAVQTLTESAPDRIRSLLRLGGRLDRAADGRLSLTREGGHRQRRVVHAGGDATGAEVSRALTAAVLDGPVTIIEHAAVIDLLTAPTIVPSRRQVTGLRLRHSDGRLELIAARAVVLATGGVGGLYEASTNPAEVSGAGLGLALRAGAALTDVEFVQFHPTALRVAGSVGQIPLVTEALRGEGAVLRDGQGRRIMAGRHPLADLAPRDIVARRIDELIGDGELVSLDARELGADVLRERFPTVGLACREHGIDPASEPIPVAPAQHFLCGGVRTDRWGATDVTGLYAVGEVAATGVHGANRLASNSLVEGMVFGDRVATALVRELPAPAAGPGDAHPMPPVADAALPAVRAVMSQHAGIRRDAAGLAAAMATMEGLATARANPSADAGNRWLAAAAILAAATARRESRGCHWRADHPVPEDRWRRPVVVRLDVDGRPKADPVDLLELSA